MSLLEEISSSLETAGIRHALIGALALSAYGVNRATLDLDLLVADPDSLRPELWAGPARPRHLIRAVKSPLRTPRTVPVEQWLAQQPSTAWKPAWSGPAQ